MPRPTSRSGSRPTQRPHSQLRRVTLLIRQRGFGIMSTTNQSKIVPRKVLVTGASGLLGVAAIEKFLAAGWKVVGVSRRKPQLPSGRDIDFLSVDLRDEGRARAAFEPLTDITHMIRVWHRSSEMSLRLDDCPGIGPVLATALAATIADPKAFRSGRNFSAWIGIVPKQHSSGGKNRLGGISKQGDRYL